MTKGNKEYRDWKKRVIHAKANNRGRIAQIWFDAGNKLTPDTHAEFTALMKKADKEFKEETVK